MGKAKPRKLRDQRQQESEGEGGPAERERAFLEERFSSIIPKEGEERNQVKPRKETSVPRREKFISTKHSVPLSGNFRLKLINEYRERQSQQTEKNMERILEHKADQPSSVSKKKR